MTKPARGCRKRGRGGGLDQELDGVALSQPPAAASHDDRVELDLASAAGGLGGRSAREGAGGELEHEVGKPGIGVRGGGDASRHSLWTADCMSDILLVISILRALE